MAAHAVTYLAFRAESFLPCLVALTNLLADTSSRRPSTHDRPGEQRAAAEEREDRGYHVRRQRVVVERSRCIFPGAVSNYAETECEHREYDRRDQVLRRHLTYPRRRTGW